MSRQQLPTAMLLNLAVTSPKLANSVSITGTMGIGAPSSATNGLICNPSALTGATQMGISTQPLFSSAATSSGIAIFAQVQTAAAAFTMASAYGLYVQPPQVGSGSAITTLSGVYVTNQGATGVANAVGVYVAKQSGASSSNAAIAIANLNNRIRQPAATSNSLSIESADGNMFLSASVNTHLTSNLYYDGANWQRFNTGNPSSIAYTAGASAIPFAVVYAASGGNPVTVWTNCLAIDTVGNMSIGNSTTPPKLKPLGAGSLSIEASNQYMMVSSLSGSHIGGNAYWDGANWMRYSTATGAALWIVGSSGLTYYVIGSGANPIGWGVGMTADLNGNLNVTQSVHAASFSTGPNFGGGWPISGDANISRGGSPPTGYVFLGDSNHYIGWDGSSYQLYGSDGDLHVGRSLFVNYNTIWLYGDGTRSFYANGPTISYRCGGSGTHSFEFQAGGYASVTCSQIAFSAGGTIGGAQARGYGAPICNTGQGDFILGGSASMIYMHPNLTVAIQQSYPYFDVIGFSGMRCNGVVTNSAERYKSDIATIPDALALVLDADLEGKHFTYNPPQQVERDVQKYGFIADAWHKKAPHVVTVDEDGAPTGMDYQQVGAILFQAFKEYVARTDAKIADLEARLAA